MPASETILAVGIASGGIASFIATAGVLYKKVVRPVSHTVVFMEESLPVLRDIADQFKNNGGSSLKDRIDSIHKRLSEGSERFAGLDARLVNMGYILENHLEACVALGELQRVSADGESVPADSVLTQGRNSARAGVQGKINSEGGGEGART